MHLVNLSNSFYTVKTRQLSVFGRREDAFLPEFQLKRFAASSVLLAAEGAIHAELWHRAVVMDSALHA